MRPMLAFVFLLVLVSTTATSVTVQQCEVRARQLQTHAVCSDIACLNRLEKELKNSVESTCRKALEDMKPSIAQPVSGLASRPTEGRREGSSQ